MLFEIQNSHELDYFHRMAYGTSKVIAEYLGKGEPYRNLKKVYSINIVYFSLGQGKGYAYHGTVDFVNMSDENDVLKLTEGRAEGAQSEKLETAKRMKAKGFDIQTIADLTQLSVDDIEKL